MIFAEPCRKNPGDLHRFAKIENLGFQLTTARQRPPQRRTDREQLQ